MRRPAKYRCEVPQCARRAHRRRPESSPRVMEKRDPAGAAGADDQIFLAIAVVILPGKAGAELAEGVGEQRLAPIVVEVRLDVCVAAQLRGYILKQWDRGSR